MPFQFEQAENGHRLAHLGMGEVSPEAPALRAKGQTYTRAGMRDLALKVGRIARDMGGCVGLVGILHSCRALARRVYTSMRLKSGLDQPRGRTPPAKQRQVLNTPSYAAAAKRASAAAQLLAASRPTLQAAVAEVEAALLLLGRSRYKTYGGRGAALGEACGAGGCAADGGAGAAHSEL